MNNFKKLSSKEKAEYIAIIALYPFFMLFGFLGKSIKLFGTKKRQLTASVLTLAMILGMLPVMSFTAFASGTTTVQSSAVIVGSFKLPKITDGAHLPDNSDSLIYFGQYPQNSNNANDRSPIAWFVTEKGPVDNNVNPDDYDFLYVKTGSFNVISEKVLDKCKYVNYKDKWKWDAKNWIVAYSNSELIKFENNFYSSAFNDFEKSAVATDLVTTPGGKNYRYTYPTEATSNRVFSPYYGTAGADSGFIWNAEATAYALSKDVSTGKYGAQYWTRGPATIEENFLYISHVYKTSLRGVPTYEDDGKKHELGVRPMTRVTYNSIIMASSAGAKDSGVIINDNADTKYYELTLLDTSRQFTAQLSSQVTQTEDKVTVPVTYSNANTGANEYISYILETDNGKMMEYRRVKASDAASGSFNVEIPKSVLARNEYKLKVFNEKIVAGFACDYASAVSVLSIPVDHSNEEITCWKDIQTTIDADRDVKLTKNITAEASDTQLTIEKGQNITIDLNGFTLDRNMSTPAYDGSVILNLGTLTITDTSPSKKGTITGGNQKGSGGGIYSASTLTIKHGYITGNNSTNLGGGIFIESGDTSPTLSGAITIQNNTTGNYGGGLYCAGACNISGLVEITNNTVKGADNNAFIRSMITITDTLGCMIKINPSMTSYPQTIAKGTDDYVPTDSDAMMFRCDLPGIYFAKNEKNEIIMDKVPLINLSKSNFTFTAPTDLTYSGTAKAAIVEANDNVICGEITAIKYYDESGKEAAPINAGTYTVKIDVAENYVYKAVKGLEVGSFTIEQKNLTVLVDDIKINKGQQLPSFTVSYEGFADGEGIETLKNDSAFVLPNVEADGTVNTLDTTLTEIKVKMAGGNATNYKLVYTDTAKITINKVDISDSDFETDKDTTMWQNENITLSPKGDYVQISADGEIWTESLILSAEGEKSSQSFYLKKADGTLTESKSISYKLDKTAPTDIEVQYNQNGFKSFLNTITFGLFFKETVNVTAQATDDLSGIDTIRYFAADSAAEDVTTITGWQDSLSLIQNSKKIVYIKVTDKAGNKAIVTDQGVVVYTDASPSASDVTFIKTGTEDKSTQLTLNGNTVKEIKNGNAVIAADNYTVASDGTLTLRASYLNTLEAGSYTLTASYNPLGEAYMEAAGNMAPDTTTIILTVQKAENAVTNISNIGKTYDGTAVSAPTYNQKGTGAATIEYKIKDADDSTYTKNAPKNAGDYTVRVSVAADGSYKAANNTADFTITQKEVTITGVTVEATKEYDCTTSAAITNNGTLSANYDGNNLKIKVGTAAYNDKTVAKDKTVTFSGFELEGSAAANYKLTAQPANITADITAKELTVNVSVKDKQYNGKNNAEFDGTPSLTGVIDGDTVFLTNGTPTFDTVLVGNNIAISFTDFSVSGTDSVNYELIQPTGITASIKSYTATKDTDYSVNSNDWQNKDFVATAKPGYKLSLTDTAEGIWIDTLTKSDETADGKLEFYVKTADGVISGKITEAYKIDKTPATGTISIGDNSWNQFLNTITFGLFFNETQAVSVTPDTDLSGIAKIEYASSDKALTMDEVKALTSWTAGSSVNVTVEDAKQFVYYAKITDNAGNVSYFSTNGAEFDTTAPEIAGITDGLTYYTTQIAEVTDKNLDSVTLNAAAGTSPVTLSGNTDVTYTVVATDKAGNSTTYTVTMKTISTLSVDIDSITTDNVKSSDKAAIEAVKADVSAVDTSTATQAEKDALKAITDNCDSLLTKIADTAAEVKRITDAVNAYSLATVKSSDKAAIDTLISDLDALVATQNLTEDEKTALSTVKTTANDLLTKIADTAAEAKRITDAVNAYDLATVKSSDKAAIDTLISDLDALVATQNLIAEEATALGTVKTTANDLLIKIANTAAEAKRITDAVNAYSLATVKSSDKAAIDTLISDLDTLVATQNLTAGEATALGTVKTTANNLLTKIADTAAEAKRITDAVNAYDLATVKSSDKAAIDTLISDLDALVATQNLIAEEATALGTVKTTANDLLIKIANTAAEAKRITDAVNAYDLATVKSSDKAAIDTLISDLDALVATQNLTTMEIEALGTVKTTAKDLLIKIADTAAEAKRITDAVNAYDLATVKSSDKAVLEQLVKDIDTIVASTNLTEDEIAAMNGVKTKAENLIAKISGIADLIKKLADTIAAYDSEIVKSTDKAAIVQVVTDIDTLAATENLTADEKTALDKVKTDATALLARIADTQKAIKNVTDKVNGYDINTVKAEDKTAIESLVTDIDELSKSTNLTETEKKELSEMKANALKLIDKLNPKIIEGANITYTQGSSAGITFMSDADYADFISVWVDGKVIDAKNYDVREGNTVVTLKPEYLKTLSAGKHTLSINSTTGTATADFTVEAKAEDSNSPQTGDNNNMALWLCLLLVSGGVLTTLGFTKKRKKISTK